MTEDDVYTMEDVWGFVMWFGETVVFAPKFWLGYAVVSILSYPLNLFIAIQEAGGPWRSAKEDASKILEVYGEAADETARDEESVWLASLTMSQRLLATRLLVAGIDELGRSDLPFLKEVKRLKRKGPYPRHVSKRLEACKQMRRSFAEDENEKKAYERGIRSDAVFRSVGFPFTLSFFLIRCIPILIVLFFVFQLGLFLLVILLEILIGLCEQ